jgi:hypothetical protein
MVVIELEENELIEESDKHKITVVTIDDGWGNSKKMYKLWIKYGDSWFSFRRSSYASYGLRELKELAGRYGPVMGFFCTHGVGDPFEELTKKQCGYDALPLEPFTSLVNCGGYWSFGGNHKGFSGAFGYKIFRRDIVKYVYDFLNKNNVRDPPNRYHPKLYPVEL